MNEATNPDAADAAELRRVLGHNDLDARDTALMTDSVALEQSVAEHLLTAASTGVDPRALSLARTNFQQGFYWLRMAIGRPTSPLNKTIPDF